MSEVSPRPWKAVENSWQYTTIYDANGNEVCRLNLERFAGLSEDTQEHYEAIQRADVEMILQAAALTPQGKGQQVLKSGQSQEISSYAEGKGGGDE